MVTAGNKAKRISSTIPQKQFIIIIIIITIIITNIPDITLPLTASRVAGPVPSPDLYELGDCVIISYLLYIILRVNLFCFP